MEKLTKKYDVLQSLTKDAIAAIGTQRFLRKHRISIGMMFVGWFMVVWSGAAILQEQADGWKWAFMAASLSMLIYPMWRSLKAGKALYNSVKDNPEPIDLREVK